MNMRKGRTVLAVLASLTFIVPALSGQYKVSTENGVTVITNGKKPVPPKGAPAKLVLEEIYTIGGGDSPDASFVAASALDVLKDGTVYVLDTKDSRVKVFDAAGKFVRAFGRAGQGPGELNQPVGILITPESEVLVEDALNRRLAVFALDGTFRRQMSTSTSLGLFGIQMDDRGLIVARSLGLGEGGKMSMDVKTYDRELNPKVKLASFEFQISAQTKVNPFSAMNLLFALDRQGLLYLGSAGKYEIKVVSAEGKLLKTVGREYDPVVITQADKDEMLKAIPSGSGVNVKEMLLFPDVYPPFANFVFAEEGRLLVRTFEKGQAKKEFYWDVFDADGRYIAKVPIVHDITLWRDGKAYFFVEDEDGYRLLRCCRVRWDR
ncbi:MAG: 6-bladed beta-propeller [Candidatus Aminicenantales bacterium]